MAKKRVSKTKDECCESDCSCSKPSIKPCMGGSIYGLGFIGAAIYYISTASGFWVGCLGVLKAIVWPAFLIYESLKYLGA